MNVRELMAKRAALLSQADVVLKGALDAGRATTPDEDQQVDTLMTEAAGIGATIEKSNQLTALMLALKQAEPRSSSMDPAIGIPSLLRGKRGETEISKVAAYFRNGDKEALRGLDLYAASNNTGMNITTAADGGNTVPTDHFNQIITRRDEQMLATKLGVRRFGGKGTTMNVPIDDEADGEFVTKSEMGDDNTTNVFDRDAPAIGTAAMTLVKYTKKIELTDELLEDEDSDLLSFVEEFIGRGIAKTHNNLLVTEALANGTAALTLDSATTIGATEIPELWYLLPDYYATDEASVGWLMRRATEGVIRGLAGTTGFYYAPTPGGSVVVGRPMLWGAPVYNTGKMPAIGATAKSVLLGNFYYMGLREGKQMSFLRDPYTVDGKVILKYYFRCVYKVLQAAAIIFATNLTT
jgi:HK97 family phage major capsid protein